MKQQKKSYSFVLCMVLIVALALCMMGCSPEIEADGVERSFTFKVVADGQETTATVTTDKATVGEALLEEGLIAGEQGQYGLMVTEINGVRAVYEESKTYWAFYINGEYANSGVDTTPVTDGTTYEFRVEK